MATPPGSAPCCWRRSAVRTRRWPDTPTSPQLHHARSAPRRRCSGPASYASAKAAPATPPSTGPRIWRWPTRRTQPAPGSGWRRRPPPRVMGPAPAPPAADWPAVEAWLTAWAGPEDPQTPPLTEGLPWRRGLELLRAGLHGEADDQFAALMNDVAGGPWPLYRLARALDGEGQTATAARAAARLIGERGDAPPTVLRLAYPDDYLDLAADEAEANGFPPLLLLALVRQESFFDPDAESSADALGLTQVIPSTADEIAGQIDDADFTYADLFRPTVSLRFGSHYLRSQLHLFEGHLFAAPPPH